MPPYLAASEGIVCDGTQIRSASAQCEHIAYNADKGPNATLRSAQLIACVVETVVRGLFACIHIRRAVDAHWHECEA